MGARPANAWTGGGIVLLSLDRIWRLIATGFAFALIFGGGALAALTILPVIAGLGRSGSKHARKAQYAIQGFLRFYVSLLQGLGLIKLSINDIDRLTAIKGHLVIANHPTLLDVVLLMAFIPRVQCIVKHELWSSRYLGGVVRLAGYIPNNLEPEALLDACRNSLDIGDNLLIFPEGTRTRPGAALHFHRGFANIALLAKARIQLITIFCNPLTLTKGEPWWRIPLRRPHFRIAVGDELDAKRLLDDQSRSHAARALVRHIENYYGEQLATG